MVSRPGGSYLGTGAALLALGGRRRAVNVRVLTGRFPVSKAPNKVSPDLDTPTDLSSQAVKKVSEAL